MEVYYKRLNSGLDDVEFQLDELLTTWEGNYKKGLLTFWLLLLLHEREAYAFEISDLVADLSQGSIKADEKSIYRALNRFEKVGIVTSQWRDSDIGPPRRYYRLTEMGTNLLRAFIQRNILLLNTEAISKRIHNVLERANSST